MFGADGASRILLESWGRRQWRLHIWPDVWKAFDSPTPSGAREALHVVLHSLDIADVSFKRREVSALSDASGEMLGLVS